MKKTVVLIILLIVFKRVIQAQSPLFPNSVVSNDIDFILETDPDVYLEVTFLGLDDKEMPSSLSEELFDTDTFVFQAEFEGGHTTEIWCHSSFATQEAAQEYAEKLGPRLGKLPAIQREMLNHVVIHNGNAGAYAETEGQFFILYSENMDDRISTNDLEETVFHESVHSSLQAIYEGEPIWTDAQDADQAFITEYAQDLPGLEDMPETALFAYAYLTYPGRLPQEVEEWMTEYNQNKLEFFSMFYGENATDISEINELNLQLIIYPNPAKDELFISSAVAQKAVILDSFGRMVTQIDLYEGKNEIDVSHFSAGVYFIKSTGYTILKVFIE